MATITNEADILLQATSPRLNSVSSNYISISTNTNIIILRASGIASPSSFIATPLLNGQLQGIQNLTWTIDPSNTTYSVDSITKVLTVQAQDVTVGTTVTVTASLTYLGFTYTRSVSFNKQSNVATAELSLINVAVPANSIGTVLSYTGASTTMSVYVGNQDDSANWTYSVAKTNVTTSEAINSRVQTVTSLTSSIGYIAITASKTGFDSITKTFSITKQTQGAQGTQGTQGTQGSQGDSIQGNPGLKTANGLLYYQSASATAPSKTGLTGTYNFSTNAVILSGSDSNNWSVNAPVFQASNGNNYWYVRFTVTESSSGSNAGTLVLGTVSQTIGFSGLVTFSNNTITNGSSSFNYTAIDGNAITTGSITSNNYIAPTSPSIFAGSGTKFNLTDGSIISKTFVIDTSGNAIFSGSVTSGEIFTAASGNRIELNKKTSGTGDNRLKVYNQTNGQILSIGGTGSESLPPISISLLNPDISSNNYAEGLEILVPGSTSNNIVNNRYISVSPFMVKTKSGESDATYGNQYIKIGGWSSQPPDPPSLSGSYRYPPLGIDGFVARHDWQSHNMFISFNSFRDTFNNPGANPQWKVATFSSYKAGSPAQTNEVVIGDWTNNYAINIVTGVFRYGGVTIVTPPNNTTQYLRADGTWQTVSSGYTLPLAANGTRGGVQIGFSTNSGARNYAVQLSGEQMYVNVPWTDTDTDTWIANSSSQAGYVASGSGQANKVWKTDGSGNPAWRDDSDTVYSLPLAANGIRGGVQIGYTQSGQNYPVQLSGEKMFVNVPWTDTNSGGTVISVATGNGLTGGTIQTSGTIQMSGSYTGSFSATGEITAYSSDARLKTNIRTIDNAINKVLKLSGIIYNFNDLAETYGYAKHTEHVGLLAQDVYNVLPQAVALAPFDIKKVDGKEISKSGENYLTIKYEKLVALLVEAVKEQQAQIEELKQLIKGGNN